jgi:hypothetical protein
VIASRRRQQGAFLPFVVITMVPFVLVIGMLFNTGAQIIRRQEAQNAADAAALSHATLTARAMNLLAMNNTAITQVFAINILGVTSLPVLAEMDIAALKEQGEIASRALQAGEAAAACAAAPNPLSCGYASYLGSEVAAREYHLIFNIFDPLIDLHRDAFSAVEFGTIAAALGEMNRRVVEEFPAQAAGMHAQLSELNGVGTAPRVTAAYAQMDDLPPDLRHISTDLPVNLVDIADLEAMETTVGAMAPIKRTGERGASAYPGDSRNFYSHGYDNGEGPYAHARERAVREMEEVKEALERRTLALVFSGPRENVRQDYESMVDAAWNTQSVLHRVLNLDGFSIDFVQVYVLRQDFFDAIAGVGGLGGFVYDGNDLSVFATVGNPLVAGPVFPSRFFNRPGAVYGQAQAELYNSVYPDLYSQDWRAKLRPASMLNSDDYFERVRDNVGYDRDRDGDLFDPLASLMQRTDRSVLRALNVH